MKDIDTIKKAAQFSMDIQDACNAGAIIYDMPKVVDVLWREARLYEYGTDYVNEHPILTLILDKLLQLNGRKPQEDSVRFSEAYRNVSKMLNKEMEGNQL